ncbi:MAG: hypothetical protein MMC23_004745 [Stictis urceolatum]|nr:hypothetical protein [Stictis urceolata]
MAAAAWDASAPISDRHCCIKAIVRELKTVKGTRISAAQLVSRIQHGVLKGNVENAMPIHRASVEWEKPSAVFCDVRKDPPVRAQAPRERVALVTSKVTVEGTSQVPLVEQWKKWLTTHTSRGLLDITIDAVWATRSVVLTITMAFEICAFLPDVPEYEFFAHVRSPAVMHHHRLLQPRPQSNIIGGQRKHTTRES